MTKGSEFRLPTLTKSPPAHLQTKRRRRRPKPNSIHFRSIPMPPERAVLLDATPPSEYPPLLNLSHLLMMLPKRHRGLQQTFSALCLFPGCTQAPLVHVRDLRGAAATSRCGGTQPRVSTPCSLSPHGHPNPAPPIDPRGAAATSRRGATHRARRERWRPTATGCRRVVQGIGAPFPAPLSPQEIGSLPVFICSVSHRPALPVSK